jgi:hypothetical protein
MPGSFGDIMGAIEKIVDKDTRLELVQLSGKHCDRLRGGKRAGSGRHGKTNRQCHQPILGVQAYIGTSDAFGSIESVPVAYRQSRQSLALCNQHEPVIAYTQMQGFAAGDMAYPLHLEKQILTAAEQGGEEEIQALSA